MKIISEWKKSPKKNNGSNKRIKPGHKRVMAIVDNKTVHIDVPTK